MENKKLIEKAICYIQKNPCDNLSLEDIATSAGFSLTYFDAMFKRHTGYSPVEYSRIYKLTRSALALRRTDKTVLDIALEHGYESPESFARAFKGFYSISPTAYREKFSDSAVTWHDLSGRIAISRFCKAFPVLKIADKESALDFCFTHSPHLFGEVIVAMSVTDTAVLTLGDTDELKHFIIASDYNSSEAAVEIVAACEEDAIPYVKMLCEGGHTRFTIHKPMECVWEKFDSAAASYGLVCRCGYDMLYTADSIEVPCYGRMEVRELFEADLPIIRFFKERGGCADCHIRAMELHFSGKGNAGMRVVGLFDGGDLFALAMPSLDTVRDMKKYDIGAIFNLSGNDRSVEMKYDMGNLTGDDRVPELLWKHIINVALDEGALIGNSNALPDDMNPYEKNSPLGVEWSERVGLTRVAINCGYSK